MPKSCTERLNTPTLLFYQKFERFRSKIIQATFSTAGCKAPQAELTDEEVLEAMQVRGSFKHCCQLRRHEVRAPTAVLLSTCLPTSLYILHFQKIINERLEFHQMLEQNGIKVPALHSTNTSNSSLGNAKGR